MTSACEISNTIGMKVDRIIQPIYFTSFFFYLLSEYYVNPYTTLQPSLTCKWKLFGSSNHIIVTKNYTSKS